MKKLPINQHGNLGNCKNVPRETTLVFLDYACVVIYHASNENNVHLMPVII